MQVCDSGKKVLVSANGGLRRTIDGLIHLLMDLGIWEKRRPKFV